MSELILIVDDEPGILSTLGGILSDEGYSTLTTTSGESALTLYQEKRPAVVFLDIWLADRDGLETLQALREADPTAAVVMMSGHGTTSTAVKAIKMGAYDYLEKPLSYKRAVDAAAGALEYKRTLQAGAAQTRPSGRRDRGEAERRFTAAAGPAASRRDRPPPAHPPPLDRGLRPGAPLRPAHRHGPPAAAPRTAASTS